MAVGSTLLNSSHSGVCVWRREIVEVDRDRRGKPVPWSPGSNGCILTFLESITLLLDTLSWPILTLEGKAKATRVKRKAITSGNQGSKEGKSLRSWGHKEEKNPTWGHKEGRRNLVRSTSEALLWHTQPHPSDYQSCLCTSLAACWRHRDGEEATRWLTYSSGHTHDVAHSGVLFLELLLWCQMGWWGETLSMCILIRALVSSTLTRTPSPHPLR